LKNQEERFMDPISILLADDHTLVRAGIRALVEKLPEVTVVAEARDGREALRLIKEHRPDLVLMDIAMPGLNGLEATARISRKIPGVRVIILSMYANEEYVRAAINAGAAGYLVKRGAAAELEDAIIAVAGGDTYFSPLISGHIKKEREGKATLSRAPLERLTPRQREILQLIAERHSTKQIAQLLGISIKTVETHRAQLMDRLGIHDVPGLVRFAIRIGLTSIEE
jgi:DNA-binding NarL/FixJ family response regulator